MQLLQRFCRIEADTKVLDIGGTPYNWQFAPV
jgi:hypothetical protein